MRIWVSRMVFGFGQGEKSGFGMGSLRGRRAEAVFVMVVRSEGVVKRSDLSNKYIYIYIYILQSCYSIYCSLIAKIIGFKSFDVV